jgi:hypothetical protein
MNYFLQNFNHMQKCLFKNIHHTVWSFLICTTVIFTSCDSYNFSDPQPIDKKNIVVFPPAFRGKWTVKDDNDFFYIGKQNVTMHRNESVKIVRGAWPRLNNQGNFIQLPPSYKSFYTIRYDSLKFPVDTIMNYLLDRIDIYEVNEDGKLGKANHYHLEKDTFMLYKNELTTVDLGKNAFLRKLNDEYYVFNMNCIILGEDKPWWQIIVVQVKAGRKLVLWDCTDKLKRDPAMFYRASGTGNYYFNCHWTTPDIFRLIREGKFSRSSMLEAFTL